MELAFLVPYITAAHPDGRQPVDITAERLTSQPTLPVAWAEWRRLLSIT